MTLLRARLATFALLAAVLTATAAPLAASAGSTCAMKHHDCGRRAGPAHRCCIADADSSSQNGPVEARVQLRVDMTSAPAMPVADVFPARAARFDRARAYPPGSAPPDLVTLFSAFLI